MASANYSNIFQAFQLEQYRVAYMFLKNLKPDEVPDFIEQLYKLDEGKFSIKIASFLEFLVNRNFEYWNVQSNVPSPTEMIHAFEEEDFEMCFRFFFGDHGAHYFNPREAFLTINSQIPRYEVFIGKLIQYIIEKPINISSNVV